MMPATCDHCGRQTLVHACPQCLKAMRTPKARAPRAYRCKPCLFGTVDPKTRQLRAPYPKCVECVRARGGTVEVTG